LCPQIRVPRFVSPDSGNITSLKDPLGKLYSFSYDSSYQLVASTNPLGAATSYSYDTSGNLISETDETGKVWSYEYDALDRLTSATDPLGRKTSLSFDPNGNVTEIDYPDGSKTSYSYDALGRLTEETRPDGQKMKYNYDPATGDLTGITDPKGRLISMSYDQNSRLVSRARPGYGPESFAYDPNGNLTSYTKKDGATTFAYSYDPMNRNTGIDAPGTVEDVSYTLQNQYGMVTAASNGYSSSAITYDSDRRPYTSKDTFKSAVSGLPDIAVNLTWAYDNNDNVLAAYATTGSESLINGAFEHDAANRLNRAVLSNAYPATTPDFRFAYDPADRLTKITRTNNVNTSFSYDDAGELTAIADSNASLTSEGYTNRSLSRNSIGMINRIVDSDGATSFGYDSLYRLVSAIRPAAAQTVLPDESYSYDTTGNRTSSSTGASVDPDTRNPIPDTLSYDPATDQLLSDPRYSYSYDANGNLTQKLAKSDGRVVKYGYDSFDRLITVEKYADQTATAPASFVNYTYDWAGRMIERKSCNDAGWHAQTGLCVEFGGHDPNLPCNSGSCPLNSNITTTRYAYQGVNLVAEFDAQGKSLASYFHLPGTIDHPLLMKRGTQIFYYHYDELGSVTQITNALGQIVKEYKYDSFGRIVLEVGDLSNPFTYTGRQWDPEAGIYLYRARAYDPETGRFLQQDPVFSVNPYPYTANNPINYTDPFGLSSTTWSVTQKIPGSNGGKGCSFTRIRTQWAYCEDTGCTDCCCDCYVAFSKKCSSINQPDHYRIFGAEKFTSGVGCSECWLGTKALECADKCKNSSDGNCFAKCMHHSDDSDTGEQSILSKKKLSCPERAMINYTLCSLVETFLPVDYENAIPNISTVLTFAGDKIAGRKSANYFKEADKLAVLVTKNATRKAGDRRWNKVLGWLEEGAQLEKLGRYAGWVGLGFTALAEAEALYNCRHYLACPDSDSKSGGNGW
jgi:RHS repeat-associated protein